VLVSAGAYESPKLLMLSGIGPAAELPLFGIEVVADLPVGHGLQDHFMALINYLTDVESLMTAVSPENVALLESAGRGPLTSNIGEAGGFFRSDAGLPAPDLQLHLAPVLFYDAGLGMPTAHGYGVAPCVLNPSSRGRVTLRSANPHHAPRILHNYLSTQDDRDRTVAGIRLSMDIASQPALAEITTGAFDVPQSDSTEDILAFARRSGSTIYHPTSSCAIGSVVDPGLNVLGVDGLRVVDASVMPAVTRGNTNAPTIMIAERAADLIRG
jgi:choline dehydrogenase